MAKFDESRTGSLLKDEVKELMQTVMVDAAPMMGGVSDADVDHVMRIGGDTVKPEITYEELPLAISILLATEAENVRLHELFLQHDTDKTGKLPKGQLKTFMTEFNSGVEPFEKDLKYIIAQFDVSGDGAIELPELKAAVASWFVILDKEVMPTTREQAKAMGYTDAEIDDFVKEVEAMPDDAAAAAAGALTSASGTFECLCKGCGFEVSGEPSLAVHCHCESCRVYGGEAARLAAYPPAQFKLTKGDDKLIKYESTPGKWRMSCGTCGSFVHNTLTNGLMAVPLGGCKWDTTNGAPVVPKMHIFMSDCGMEVVNDKLPHYQEFP